MKKLILILFLIGNSINLYCQDSVFEKKSWKIEAGFNILIPVHSYIEDSRFDDCFDCPHEYFLVNPKLTLNNIFVNALFNRSIYSRKKSDFSLGLNLGFLHREIETVKNGYSSAGDGGSYFEGMVSNIYRNDYINFGVGTTYKNKISKKLIIENQIRLSAEILFNKYFYQKNDGNTFSERSYNFSGFKEVLFPINYSLYLNYPYKRLSFLGGIEIPLLLLNDVFNKEWREYYLTNTLPTSIDKISYFNLGLKIKYYLNKYL